MRQTHEALRLRLSNNADANPADWQAQLEVAHILADPNSGFHNPSRVTRYFERIFRQATDINREIPDSVIREAGLVLMTQANARKDAVKTLYYIDELIRFEKSLAEPNFSSLTTCDTFGYLISLITRNNIKALSYIEDLRQYAVKNNLPGVEHTDMMTALFYDKVLNDYRNLFGDKLIEVTVEGKKYIIVAISKWNIEMPFQGWSGFLSVEKEKDKSTPLFYGDDGKIHDDVHGETKFGFLSSSHEDIGIRRPSRLPKRVRRFTVISIITRANLKRFCARMVDNDGFSSSPVSVTGVSGCGFSLCVVEWAEL